MRRLIILLFLVIMLPLSALDFDFYGYFENQTSLTLQKNPDFQSYNKLRLDLNKDISSSFTLNSNLVFQTYHGLKTINLLDYIPSETVNNYSQQVGISVSDLADSFSDTYNDEYFLDNAYLSIYKNISTCESASSRSPWEAVMPGILPTFIIRRTSSIQLMRNEE